MSEDIDPAVLQRTQVLLGKFIKKPVLSDKLLRKPPFRFLHDICTAVMKETGFLEDILSGNDVRIELITDKEGKVAFLQKVIAAVESANNVKLSVKPTKIVAGHEASKTNEFLQALANALEKRVETKGIKKVVKKTKNSTDKREDETVKRNNVTNKPATKEPPPSDSKKDDKRRKSTEKKLDKIETKKKPPSKSNQDSKTKEKSKKRENVALEKNLEKTANQNGETIQNGENVKNGSEDKVEEDLGNKSARPVSAKYKKRTASAHPPSEPALTPSDQSVGQPTEAVDRVLGGVVNDIASVPTTPVQPVDTLPAKPELLPEDTALVSSPLDEAFSEAPVLTSTTTRTVSAAPKASNVAPLKATTPIPAQNEEVPQETPSVVRPRTAIRPPSARPASARPAAPRVRDRGQVPIQDEGIIKPVGKVNLISDQEILHDDEEEVVTVQTKQEVDDVIVEPYNLPIVSDGEGHGQLVNQILEAQKELEDDVFAKKGASGKTEIEWSTGRNIEVTKREVDRIKSGVQSLTRSANPLGKLLEYLQDDVDSMQQELQEWRERNYSLSTKLEQEKNLSDRSLEPLKLHLEELEENMRSEIEQIAALKANILRNDEKISRLLNSL